VASDAGLADLASPAFLVGMFSLIDAIIGRPIAEVIESLSIGADERGALTGHPGRLKTILDCVIAYERGAWDQCLELGRSLGLDEQALADRYLKAADWARGIFAA
jgi:EAL and modified HD-GYP domain-containing signal transduction protein